jgi:replicative DNA helicase
MKAIAKDLDVAVLVLCQLNRGNENREDKRPQLSDLRDSGALEQDADVVIFLHRESYYLERQKGKDPAAEQERLDRLSACENTMDIAIAKQRQGPITIATVFCDIGRNAIRDLAT